VLLVLDATSGQNAIQQARVFGQAINVTGLMLAKLDGTAKGGAVVAIREQLKIPVKFIGVGETPEDIEAFDAAQFVDALLNAG
jgi:fused signal recognition particle receptor